MNHFDKFFLASVVFRIVGGGIAVLRGNRRLTEWSGVLPF